jgi:hypothetical protein
VVTVTNTISVGVGLDSFAFVKLGDGWGDSSSNISSDGTAPGPGSLTGISAESLFISATLGSENLHLDGGAAAIDGGIERSDFELDVDGELRQPGAWDIGADERL